VELIGKTAEGWTERTEGQVTGRRAEIERGEKEGEREGMR
jgi:hypothetical protein